MAEGNLMSSGWGFNSPMSRVVTTPGKKKLTRSTTPSLTAQYQKMEAEAQAANKALENEIRANYQKTIDMYSANGSFMQAGNQDIANQEKNIVGQETQSLISSGLYGTTTASAIPGKVASQFTQPARLKLEDLANQRVAGARSEFSQFLNTIQNNYPDYNMLLEAMRAQNSV